MATPVWKIIDDLALDSYYVGDSKQQKQFTIFFLDAPLYILTTPSGKGKGEGKMIDKVSADNIIELAKDGEEGYEKGTLVAPILADEIMHPSHPKMLIGYDIGGIVVSVRQPAMQMVRGLIEAIVAHIPK